MTKMEIKMIPSAIFLVKKQINGDTDQNMTLHNHSPFHSNTSQETLHENVMLG